ncbi:hypothetical protein [Pseudoalteromonas sp. OANN1]|uniref:hypothetical protein n=1 Tax=Pseudoalteromonas sp. OANN1 TaxID=2954497 RepID=UPI002097EED6|nr:hypothetical protein [Pseudoalteromonas sp. OANN1]MCO7199083.1 hypothetical protein [Pseudoalteromonas sp. OANN1]
MISKEIRANNAFYSELFAELADLLAADQTMASLSFDEANSSISDFMADFIYNVSPWPVIINDNTVRTFSRVVDNMPAVLIKLLNYFARHEPLWLCDYLNISEMALARYTKCAINSEDIMCRYDAIMTNKALKLVEINIGSSLGGWWSDWLYPEIQAALNQVDVVKDWNHKYRKISENTFKAVWQSIVRLKGNDAKGNMFIFLPDTATTNLALVHQHLNTLVMTTKPDIYPEGKLFIFNELDKIEWRTDGNMAIDGEIMDTLLLPVVKGDELPISFVAKLQAYSEKRKLYVPDNEALNLLANKLLFSLAHEPKSKKVLTNTELSLIEEHIPWSTKLNSKAIHRDGISLLTEEYIKQNQQSLVFKKSQSMQGKDVLVGCTTPREEWLNFYEQNKHDSDWLIQAYCAPDLIYSADQNVGFSSYRMVWGIFGFNDHYSGAWCRAVNESNDDTVINLARGAVEFVVTEEQQLKGKLVL